LPSGRIERKNRMVSILISVYSHRRWILTNGSDLISPKIRRSVFYDD
jgi:hypothetical protein